MPSLSEEQLKAFLMTGRHILKIATLSPDGWPYVVPVWYNYDGEAFQVLARPKNTWVAYIRRDPRVALCVDTIEAPYTRVLVKGIADIIRQRWLGDWRAMAVRYLGLEAGQRYYEATKTIPRVDIRITPHQVLTWGGGGWHPRYQE